MSARPEGVEREPSSDEAQRPAPLRIRVAAKHREIRYGWELMDYARYAVQNRGWENIGIWGKKGSGKSNLSLQILYDAYKNWDEAFKHLIFTHDDFLNWLDVIREGNRVPLIVWDDINAYLPRSLYYTNRMVWEVISRSWEVIREGLSVFVWTAPRKENVSNIILRDVTMDVQVYGRDTVVFEGEPVEYSLYEVRRWFILQDKHGPERERKPFVVVETAPTKPVITRSGIRYHGSDTGVFLIRQSKLPCHLHYCGVPDHIWERYWREKRKVMEAAIESWKRGISEYTAMQAPASGENAEPVEDQGWRISPHAIYSHPPRRGRRGKGDRIPASEFENSDNGEDANPEY